MQPGDKQDDDSSDYGSDFTPDEEELLNELLERVAATEHGATAETSSTPPPPPPSDEQQQSLPDAVHDLQPLPQQPLLVTDIEDYEVPHSVRFPRVLGREAWSPSKRVRQHFPQQQRAQTSLQNHARFSTGGML